MPYPVNIFWVLVSIKQFLPLEYKPQRVREIPVLDDAVVGKEFIIHFPDDQEKHSKEKYPTGHNRC